MKYIVRPSISIPYFDHSKSLTKTIHHSSRRRGMSKTQFACRKIRNIILYRLAFMCPLNSIRIKLHRMRGITIGENVFVGLHCVLDNAYPEYIYIEDNVSIAGNNIILAHSNPYPHFAGVFESAVSPVIFKEGCWIGAGAIIMKGVTVGEKATVSAGAVVDRNVPPKSLVIGNPMKIVADLSALID